MIEKQMGEDKLLHLHFRLFQVSIRHNLYHFEHNMYLYQLPVHAFSTNIHMQ